jgi:hypothetical protein
VQRYPKFIRHLQSEGAEIALHGYHHVDLGAYPTAEAEEQLRKAAKIFSQHGIEAYGFRCPYLSCTDDLLDALPKGMFEYSSNRAIWWDVVSPSDADSVAPLFDVPQAFYKAKSALEAVCVPCTQSNMLEIPVCVPDDLQLHDGLQLGTEGMTQAWSQILHRTHQRGELFTLLFHPEPSDSAPLYGLPGCETLVAGGKRRPVLALRFLTLWKLCISPLSALNVPQSWLRVWMPVAQSVPGMNRIIN